MLELPCSIHHQVEPCWKCAEDRRVHALWLFALIASAVGAFTAIVLAIVLP